MAKRRKPATATKDALTSALIVATMRWLTSLEETVTLDQLEQELNESDDENSVRISRETIAKELARRSSDHPGYEHGYADRYYRIIDEEGVERWGCGSSFNRL